VEVGVEDKVVSTRVGMVQVEMEGPRESVLSRRLRGGVSGVGRRLTGRSVGRSTAGTYMGAFGGRSCFFAKPGAAPRRYWAELRGEVGDGVVEAESEGEYRCGCVGS
jgi:hypothetical protein